jgi:phosphatidylglycerophosphate synthase
MIESNIPTSNNETPPEAATTRNSLGRRLIAKPVGKFVTYLADTFPELQPDDLTDWGEYMVIGADVLALKFPDHPIWPTVLFTIGSLFDSADGALDREIRSRDGSSPTIEGEINDAKADKLEEIFTFAALSLIARKRGNNFASKFYALATMTSVMTAVYRADAESHGFIVAEGGVGTRQGRGILGGIGIAFNKQSNISELASATVAVSNLITSRQRLDVIKNGDKSPYYKGAIDNTSLMEAAKVRRMAILPHATGGILVGGALFLLKPKKSKPNN